MKIRGADKGTDERKIMAIRNRRLPVVGETTFYCGPAGHVHVTDEHDVAAHRHCREMEIAYYREHGEFAPLALHADWLEEGREASIRRTTAEKLPEIEAAKALLESVGYAVEDVNMVGEQRPSVEGQK